MAFKKGNTPWNKGKTGTLHHTEEWKKELSERYKANPNKTTFKRGHRPWHKDKKGVYSLEALSKMSSAKTGLWAAEKNPRWAGENVNYQTLHKRITSKLGRPHHCEHCKRTYLPHRHYQWANRSHTYKNDITDWVRLCAKCHAEYDSSKITI